MREVPHTPQPSFAAAASRVESSHRAAPLSHADVEQHLVRAVGALKSLQKRDGHWCAELEGDSILQSEYLLMKWILGQEAQPLVDGRGPETLQRILDISVRSSARMVVGGRTQTRSRTSRRASRHTSRSNSLATHPTRRT